MNYLSAVRNVLDKYKIHYNHRLSVRWCFEIFFRCTVEDGSGKALIYLTGDCCEKWLKLPPNVWKTLKEEILPLEGEFIYYCSVIFLIELLFLFGSLIFRNITYRSPDLQREMLPSIFYLIFAISPSIWNGQSTLLREGSTYLKVLLIQFRIWNFWYN